MYMLRTRPILAVIAAILALLLLSGIAYAIYRVASDPGLQSVQDAGLVKNIGVTAKPTILPTSTAGPTRSAASIGTAQTVEGVTLTLDWVYLDEGHLALGWTNTQLPEGLTLDSPSVTFINASPVQTQGWSYHTDGTKAQYISYQVIHAKEIGGKADLSVDIPLVSNSDTQKAVGSFHYELKDIPVNIGQSISLQQTYAVRYNGVEVRLKSARVLPNAVKLSVCFGDVAEASPNWNVQSASIQIGNGTMTEALMIEDQPLSNEGHCAKLIFSYNPPKDTTLPNSMILRVQTLVALDANQEVTGPWEFFVDLPHENMVPVPGQASPTPTATPASLGSQTQGDVTVTLDWAFADAKRVAVGYTITGLPEVPDATVLLGKSLLGNLDQPADGGFAGDSSTIERVAGEPGILRGSQSVIFRKPLTEKEAKFQFQITLGSDQASDIIAQFPFPLDATPFPPGVFPPSLPDHTLGTFTFDFTTQVYPMMTLQPGQVVTTNGIAMRLEKVEMSPSYAQVTLCYQKPSSKDWMVGGSMAYPTLEFGGYTATINSYSLGYDSDLGGFLEKSDDLTDQPQISSGRCVSIDFLLGNAYHLGTAKLSIPDLTQSIPEVIPDDAMKVAQAKLKAQGIEVDYTTSHSNSGGGGGPIFKTIPGGMTQQEAYQRYLEALGYVHTGPWVFTFEVQP